MKSVGIIPARFQSSRFPGKPLADIGGKSMLQRVYEQASRAEKLMEVWIATDDERIIKHAQSFDAQVVMTSNVHRSGTERCAEVARSLADTDVIVNIQGDEPFIEPDQIDQLISLITDHPNSDIATLCTPIHDPALLQLSQLVKVVFDRHFRALYFSRSPIPFQQNRSDITHYQHLGIYAYRRSVLLQLAQLDTTPLETAESLEQLRWLEHGFHIRLGITDHASRGIDTPEDLAKVLSEMEGLVRRASKDR